MENHKFVEYKNTILPGVEIKKAHNIEQSYKSHVHKELSIGYILNGCTTLEYGNNTYTFSEGEGVLFPPLVSHMCSPHDLDNWYVIMVYIDMHYYDKSITIDMPAQLTKENISHLNDLINLLESDSSKSILEEKLIELLINIEAQTQNTAQTLMPNDESAYITDIKRYLADNYREKISLNDLVKEFTINKFTLIRKFKKAFNTTPTSFLLQLKIAESKIMLQNGFNSLDICSELSFYDQSHFIREFRKMHGITPMEYANI